MNTKMLGMLLVGIAGVQNPTITKAQAGFVYSGQARAQMSRENPILGEALAMFPWASQSKFIAPWIVCRQSATAAQCMVLLFEHTYTTIVIR
jgi:hypothetical protein